tara:strand:- start:283 stop:456 length:174 start_codon:yes stop_codon:yes gene_type:complete
MAVIAFDFNSNQWYVQHSDGTLEPCHNRATAEHLVRSTDDDCDNSGDLSLATVEVVV